MGRRKALPLRYQTYASYFHQFLVLTLGTTLGWAPEHLPVRGLDSPVPSSQAEIDLARRAYYAQITHIDHQLNRMFMALYESGVLDNTAIVFTADHGEMLCDHNMVAKALPFDGSERVPFILRLPKRGDWGARQKEVTELHDLTTAQPDRVQYWRARLVDELAGREEDFIEGGALVVGRPQSPTLSDPGEYKRR